MKVDWTKLFAWLIMLALVALLWLGVIKLGVAVFS